MFLRTYTPGPALGEYIDRFWYCSDTPSHPRERILPSGTVELVINLTDDEIRIYDPSHPSRTRRFPGAFVSGPYSYFCLNDPLVHASIIGVHFRPGRAIPLLGVQALAMRLTSQAERLVTPLRADLRLRPNEKASAAAGGSRYFTRNQDRGRRPVERLVGRSAV